MQKIKENYVSVRIGEILVKLTKADKESQY